MEHYEGEGRRDGGRVVRGGGRRARDVWSPVGRQGMMGGGGTIVSHCV